MTHKGKTAIVTGAAQGIGEAYARGLAKLGASVIVSDINAEKGEAVAAAICNDGGTAKFIQTDVSDPKSAENLARETQGLFGPIDYLINNAAIFAGKRKEGLLTIDWEYYRHFMTVNVDGALIVTRAVVPLMNEAGGAIVNQSSSAAWAAGDFYSLSKAATNALTISLARELGPKKIRVNAIAPGPTNTEATMGTINPDIIKNIVKTMPLGRLGETDDITKACLFLLSDDADWITGQILSVDGGTVLRL